MKPLDAVKALYSLSRTVFSLPTPAQIKYPVTPLFPLRQTREVVPSDLHLYYDHAIASRQTCPSPTVIRFAG